MAECDKEIIGVARLIKGHGTSDAEFAILIADAWQGMGIGTELLKMLVKIGRTEKLERITGRILAENTTMKRSAWSEVKFAFW